MYAVRVTPTSRLAWPSPAGPVRPTSPAPLRAAALGCLDALCPCCDQRGLDLFPSGPDRSVLTCRHCGYVGDG